MKWLRMCSIVSVFSIYAMNDTKKHIDNSKSPILRVKTTDNIVTNPKNPDEFEPVKNQKAEKRRSVSLGDITECIGPVKIIGTIVYIHASNPAALKKQRSDEELDLQAIKQALETVDPKQLAQNNMQE